MMLMREESDCHAAYLIDLENYSDRWACLAGELDPPPGDGTTCYSYPGEWRIEGDEPSSDLRSAGDVNSLTPAEPVPHLEPKRVPATWTTLRDSSG